MIRQNKGRLLALSFLFTGVIYCALSAASWLRWADPIMDFGRELYYPWQILHGRVLQRDLYQIYGPFSDYFNALWMAVGGETVRLLFGVNLILAAGTTGVILYLFGTWLGWFSGVLAALAFMVVGVFPHVNNEYASFNFIAPYSHAATHGFMSALLVLAGLFNFARHGKPSSLYGAALFFGINFLTKAEFFFALVAAVGLFVVRVARHKPKRWEVCHRHRGGLVLTALLPVLAFLGYFLTVLPVDQALKAVAGSWVAVFSGYLTQTRFQSVISGLDHPQENILSSFLSAIWQVGWLGAAYGVFAMSRKPSPGVRLAFFVALVWLGLILWHYGWENFGMYLMPQGFMFLTCLILFVTLFGHRLVPVHPEGHKHLFFMSIWSMFALALQARMVFNTTFFSYGFVLLTPAFLGMIGFLTGVLPGWLALRGEVIEARRLQGVYALFVVLMIAGVWHHSWHIYQRMTFTIGTGENRFLAFPPAVSLNAAIQERFARWADERLRADDTLLVIPEGLIFNFLYRVVNPTRVHLLLPPDFFRLGEAFLIREIERARPRYVMVWSRPTADYGYSFMGSSREYGLGLLTWLERNYRPVYYLENGFSLREPGKRGLVVLRLRYDESVSSVQ
ncbi:MAG: hypothetical protein HQL64_05980 [Magnetococcales bacterium]|nr:hypothetical protein [Magnetococcales bacterium]